MGGANHTTKCKALYPVGANCYTISRVNYPFGANRSTVRRVNYPCGVNRFTTRSVICPAHKKPRDGRFDVLFYKNEKKMKGLMILTGMMTCATMISEAQQVEGRVIDAARMPIEAATVVLQARDSSFVLSRRRRSSCRRAIRRSLAQRLRTHWVTSVSNNLRIVID